MNRMDELFGMDVMKELQRLVDAATVGGKKEREAEQAPTREEKFRKAAKGMARTAWELYGAFLDAGFDSEQAFTLMFDLVRGFNKEALK